MRRIVALTLLGLATTTPLSAQFEGTVTMKMSTSAGNSAPAEMNAKIAIKGDRTATIVTMPASAGPMAGAEMRSIYDPGAHTMTVLMPVPAGMGAAMPALANAKGMKMVTDMSKMSAGRGPSPDANVSIKKVGTSETVVGLSCDDYELTSDKGDKTRMCMTSALGRFMYPQSSGGFGGRRSGGASAPPAWAAAFGDKPMFPLKVWTSDGKVAMEVTAIDKSPVSSSVFEIPDGYVDLSAMMAGMGRPPR